MYCLGSQKRFQKALFSIRKVSQWHCQRRLLSAGGWWGPVRQRSRWWRLRWRGWWGTTRWTTRWATMRTPRREDCLRRRLGCRWGIWGACRGGGGRLETSWSWPKPQSQDPSKRPCPFQAAGNPPLAPPQPPSSSPLSSLPHMFYWSPDQAQPPRLHDRWSWSHILEPWLIKFSSRNQFGVRKYKQYTHISGKCLARQTWLDLPSFLMSLYQWKFATEWLDLCTTSSPGNKQQISSTTICKPTKYSSIMLTCKIHSQVSLVPPRQYSCCLGGHKLADASPDLTLNIVSVMVTGEV